jgi:hypothetical protein
MKPLEILFKRPIRSIALLLYATVLLQAGLSKILGGRTPDWFFSQFENTFLNFFSGSLSIQFFAIATLETLIGALSLTLLLGVKFGACRLSGERAVFFASSLLFIGLCFGLRVSSKFQDAGLLFFYAIASLVLADLVAKESAET